VPLKAHVLVVDDDPQQRDMLAGFLEDLGHSVRPCADGEQALAQIERGGVDIVLTDLKMPRLSGLELLKRGRAANPRVDFILLTAHGTIETAVEAIREGAYDFLLKPVDPDSLERTVARLRERQFLSEEVDALRLRLRERLSIDGVVAESKRMQDVLSLVTRAAQSNATILLAGESGTGKELMANIIHQHSPRRDGPFIPVNCAAIPESLLESELFGHLKGAFTGADRGRDGLFRAAEGGTIFLDEIGEMGGSLQAKLLRVLQERTIRPVGSSDAMKVDVRVLCATNRDLQQEVAQGRFREDLYYRVNVFQVVLPSLRARREDLPPLVDAILKRQAEEEGLAPRKLTSEAFDLLAAYPFPGNVRELENILLRAAVLCRGDAIGVADLPPQLAAPPEDSLPTEPLKKPLDKYLEEVEARLIRAALARNGWVQTRAAQDLGLHEKVLRYRMKKLGIERPAARHK